MGNKFIDSKIANKNLLADNLLKNAEIFKDKELELSIKSSVAAFYYYSGNSNATTLMKEALSIAADLNNKSEIKRIKTLLAQMEENPEPYKIKDKIGN